MKKKIAMLMGVLALSVFAACGNTADVDIDYDEDYDIDWEEDYDESDDALDELLGYWEGENVFVLMYTFYPEGNYSFSSDGGLTEDGTYELSGTDLLLTAEDGSEYSFTFSDGRLYDSDDTEYFKKLELGDIDVAYYEESDDPLADVAGYWEGDHTPPNDWFIFTSEGEFYCSRDDYGMEWGTYTYDGNNVYLTFADSGETETYMMFDYNYLLYEPCEGLNRTNRDDTVDQWILDEVGR
ncbi:MAG: hypothetical protein K5871_05785 [Lachnospiraceae bacterium]|nr:hypothetical protein [Lachnospiraceae bacterium]